MPSRAATSTTVTDAGRVKDMGCGFLFEGSGLAG
jgi:hypothetical protein